MFLLIYSKINKCNLLFNLIQYQISNTICMLNIKSSVNLKKYDFYRFFFQYYFTSTIYIYNISLLFHFSMLHIFV